MVDDSETKIREVERNSVVLKRLDKQVQELASRHFPWATVLSCVTPPLTGLVIIWVQIMNQSNLTSDRLLQVQKTIDINQLSTKERLEELRSVEKKLDERISALENKRK